MLEEVQQLVGGIAVEDAKHLHVQVVVVMTEFHLEIGTHDVSPSCPPRSREMVLRLPLGSM